MIDVAASATVLAELVYADDRTSSTINVAQAEYSILEVAEPVREHRPELELLFVDPTLPTQDLRVVVPPDIRAMLGSSPHVKDAIGDLWHRLAV